MHPRFPYVLTTFVILILACVLPGAAAPTAFPLPPTPAFATLAPAVPPAPTVAPPSAGFRDDFDGSLGAGWEWLGEDPTHWDLTSAPGHLRIVVQGTNINDGTPRNFLVRASPQGNFEMTTAVRFAPGSNFQLAGLLVYQDQGNAMQFGPAYAPCTGGAPGQCVFFDSYQAGQFGVGNFGTFTGGLSPVNLRLRRTGTSYTAYFSADGSAWTEIGTHQSSIAPRYVGLIGSQGYQGEVPADFDFFTLQAGP